MPSETLYCVNHPNTETLLRCYRCNRPVCTKCVTRTPVGLICKDCLSIQRAGYYTATPVDYAVAGIVGTLVSMVGGAIAAAMGGFFLLAIFYGPFAGGVIAEIIRLPIQKRRGRYIWLVACASVIVGGLVGAGFFPLGTMLFSGRGPGLIGMLLALPVVAVAAIFNLGFLIYVVLAVGTVYARLKS
jgi:hypothetical protein